MSIKEQKSKNKKVWWIVGGVAGAVVLVGAIIALVLAVTHKDYKVVDLTGKTLAEACTIARSHGWTVEEPIGGYYSSWPKKDCDNTYAVVNSYDYNKDEENGNYTVNMKWNYSYIKEDERQGKTVAEICEMGKARDLTIKFTKHYSFGDEYDAITSCDDTRVPDNFRQSDGEIYMGFANGSTPKKEESKKEETKTETNNATNNTSSNANTSVSSLGKCKTGDKYAISDNGHYVVGIDIPAGTYSPEKGSISFDIFKTQSKFDADDGSFTWLTSEAKTVQLNDGNIIDNVISTGNLVCK